MGSFGGLYAILIAVIDPVVESTSGVMVAQAILNFVMKMSLNELWSQINMLQLIVILPIINLSFPEIVLKFCEKLTVITSFEIIDPSILTNGIFGEESFSEILHEPLTERYALLKFED